MDKIKNAYARTKNFVVTHKVAVAVTATAIPLVALQLRTAREFNTFLDEKGLTDEYYNSDDES